MVLQTYYMATVTYSILKHHRKADGTYNIKYRLTHKGKQIYHASSFFVTDKQLKKDYSLKDIVVLDKVNAELAQLRSNIASLSFSIEHMDAKDILKSITTVKYTGSIDFLKFCYEYLSELKADDNTGAHRNSSYVVNTLDDFVKGGSLDINDFNSSLLRSLEKYISTPREIVRKLKGDVTVKKDAKVMDRNGIYNFMTVLKNIFKRCKKKYNSEFNTIISHDPFSYYEIPKKKTKRKKGMDYSSEYIIDYRDKELKGSKEIARDIFMLSFYMCGMNAKDMYDGNYDIANGRLEYKRSKTKNKRSDEAFISIKLVPEAEKLLNKYNKKYLQSRYSAHSNFIIALSNGMKDVEMTFYTARHIFASWAFNRFRYSIDEIGVALNHSSNRITNDYIAKDWSLIDRIQSDVLSLLAGNNPVDGETESTL